jgi:hypothetical protein
MNMSPRLSRGLYASTALIALSGAASAADITYVGPINGGATGNWTIPTVWSTNTVSTAADTVIVAPGTNSIGVSGRSAAEIGKIYFAPGSKPNANGVCNVGTSGIVKIYGLDGIGLHYASAEDSTGPGNAQIIVDLEYSIDNPNGGTLRTGLGRRSLPMPRSTSTT